MLDIRLVRSNPDLVKENIKKKFQDEKLAAGRRGAGAGQDSSATPNPRGDYLRGQRNTLSKQIGGLMAKGQQRGGRAGQRRRSPRWPSELEELEVQGRAS